ncbi:MAG TPA: LLM class F420-dependent oxidoreductase [Mycobacterium sp.]|nr:LLM class F420-dependent oxidoreductase [Mycobacterium sp.]
MTDPSLLKPDAGRYGVWAGGAPKPEQAAEIEKLGYGAIWVGGSPAAELEFAEPILEATESLTLATGIVNIWTAPAEAIADSYHRIEKAYPGRFLLGIGVGHPEANQEYRKPYDALVDYLDTLDKASVPTSRRVVAALGPRVAKLAAQRSAGVHPYLTTPEHTAQIHNLVGPSVFVAPEHKVILTTNADEAREVGRKTVGFYLDLTNYVANWKRIGFTDEDVEKPGSDKLIDAVVAHGTAEQIAARLGEHLESGADHVAIQVLGGRDRLIPTLTELARPLGLKSGD